jgi:predicted RNase H-like HicB family nuclease
MEHLVVVGATPEGHYSARALTIPEVTGQGTTEAEAIEQVKQALAKWLASRKVVRVEVPTPGGTGNPWLDWFGYAKDDPHHQEYLDEIRRAREEADLALRPMSSFS